MKKIIPLLFLLLPAILLESPWGIKLDSIILKLYTQTANQKLSEFHQVQTNQIANNSCLRVFKNLNELTNQGFRTYLFVHENLVAWSSNQENVALQQNDLFRLGKTLVKTSKGSYLSESKQSGDTLLVSLFVIESNYPIQNTYLKNSINPELGKAIKSIKIIETPSLPQLFVNELTLPVVPLLSLVFWILAFLYFAHLLKNSGSSYKWLIIAGLILGRILGLYFQFPASIATLSWFSPQEYAFSWWSPSIGDWFLNILISYWLLNQFISDFDRQDLPPIFNKFLALILPTFSSVGLVWITQNISTHSEFFLDPSVLVKLQLTSWLALTGLCLVGWGVFRISSHWILQQKNLVFFLISLGISLLFSWFHWKHWHILLIILLFFSGLALHYFFSTKGVLKNISTQIALAGVTISIFLSIGLHYFNYQKETAEVEYLANKLVSGRDWVQEYLFKRISQKLQTDRKIKNALTLHPIQAQQINESIRGAFEEEWSDFELGFILFSLKDSLIIRDFPNNTISIQETELLLDKSEPSGTSGLWIAPPGSKFSYIAKLKMAIGRDQANNDFNLYILFWPKTIQNSIGYPDLLLEKGIGFKEKLQNYSYRITQNDSVIQQNFVHWQTNSIFQKLTTPVWKRWINQDLYWKIISDNGNTQIEITRPNSIFASFFNSFTILFSFFFILGILSSLISRQSAWRDFLFLSFRNRIITATTGLLTLTLFSIGFASARLMVKQIDHKNIDLAEEKLHTIKNRIEKEKRISNSFLLDLALESNVDIHIYNAMGHLVSTTRPVIFRDGYTGKMINPEALNGLKESTGDDSFFREKIGTLSFLSAYTPLQVLGNTYYINIPFFARQEEIREELSSMISSLLNIYFILVSLSVVLTLLISGYITSPLETIATKLTNVDLNKPEYIQWKGEDEIGKLVIAYNHMVDELAHNVEELAKSERESAWREMAKQVAHEIKNPLTPMKLQVQHLSMRYKAQSPGWEEQLVKTLALLEEQIDNLANIANAFSNFAKMPQGNPEGFDCREVLTNLSNLLNNEKDYRISLDIPNSPLLIFIDKQQFSRSIQNLLKNAIQSIPSNQFGQININAYQHENQVIIRIQDNGSGIPNEVQEKIFMPNFTTKSSGMGLGLAMAKNIMEQANGQISFETGPNQGTTFQICLPAIS
ncbi:MAG: HAMP domain-containing histidine kinase [Bacteroidia bacterium]|nr:HAMP domain-containing histidine kinase [Bacteroidia bacterium]